MRHKTTSAGTGKPAAEVVYRILQTIVICFFVSLQKITRQIKKIPENVQ